MQTACIGNASVVRLLLGAIPAPLVPPAAQHALQQTNDIDIARMLLNCRPDLSVKDACGHTELHRRYNDPALTELLLDAGADVNAQSLLKSTALHLTLNPQVKKLLLLHGADLSIKNLFGLTAAEMANNTTLQRLGALLLYRHDR